MRDSEIISELARCVKCGQCKSVCPVYRVTGREEFLARGKLVLCQSLLQGKLSPSRELGAILDSCMKCYQCVADCPTGIHPVHLILDVRRRLPGNGLKAVLTRFLMRTIIPHRQRYNLFMRAMSLAQKLLPRLKGATRHLPLVFEKGMAIPELAGRTALRILPERTGSGSKRVGLFLGCLINYVYPKIATAAVKLLEMTGHTVIVPRDQVCCGIPALYLGDVAAFARLRSKNIRSFHRLGLDAVVTACASCATSLKEEYPRASVQKSESAQGAQEVGPLGAPVYEISEFLADFPFSSEGGKEKVTYHDPCHLRFAQGIWKEPRNILSKVAEIVESDEPWRCCGGGGSFSIFYHKLSQAIGKEKCKAILETNAQTVLTACPGCVLQLRSMLAGSVSVKHIVEFLAQECAGEKEKLSRNIEPADSVSMYRT